MTPIALAADFAKICIGQPSPDTQKELHIIANQSYTHRQVYARALDHAIVNRNSASAAIQANPNQLRIADHATLQDLEYRIFIAESMKSVIYDKPVLLDMAFMMRIHFLLFGELYQKSAERRQTALSKHNKQMNLIAHYCAPNEIDQIFINIQSLISAYVQGEKSESSRARILADVYFRLSFMRPFLYGNTRAIKLAILTFATQHKIPFTPSNITKLEWDQADFFAQPQRDINDVAVPKTYDQGALNNVFARLTRTDRRLK